VVLAVFATSSLPICAFGQNNPVPQIVGPVHPDAVAPGSGAFALSVYGANFVPGAVGSMVADVVPLFDLRKPEFLGT
jgi:hypothetical protein